MARGGKREGAGRKVGEVPQIKRDLADIARPYGDRAIAALAEIMANKQEAASARVSAAVALLDRGFGRPSQTIIGAGENGEHLHKVSADEAFSRLAGRLAGPSTGATGGDTSAE